MSENKNHPNTELQAPHLSDAMVKLLSSGKISNRLLCKLAAHPDFLRPMVAMEIFIDRAADMRLNPMDLIPGAARQTIRKEPSSQENDFCTHILHDDLDSMVRDIREAHLKGKTTAGPQPALDEVKENFEQAIQLGNNTEAMIHAFCVKMQIPFEKISSEDFSAFLRMLSLFHKKAPLLTSHALGAAEGTPPSVYAAFPPLRGSITLPRRPFPARHFPRW